MPVLLGASLSDPNFVLVQIIHTLSIFFIFLGVVRVVLGILSLALFNSGSGGPSPPFLASLSFCFHVPLRSLFAVTVVDAAGGTDGSATRFFFMHVFSALCMSYPLALTIQRRKFALDFVCTIYAVYFVLCSFVERRLSGGGPTWWLALLAGFGIMYSATMILCRRRELQAVFFSTTSPATNTISSGGDGATTTLTATTLTTPTTMTAAVAPGILNASADLVIRNAEGDLFVSGSSSPVYGVDAVLMGPGNASKRR